MVPLLRRQAIQEPEQRAGVWPLRRLLYQLGCNNSGAGRACKGKNVGPCRNARTLKEGKLLTFLLHAVAVMRLAFGFSHLHRQVVSTLQAIGAHEGERGHVVARLCAYRVAVRRNGATKSSPAPPDCGFDILAAPGWLLDTVIGGW